ncbi:MAG: VOC family protein [Rubrobacteraceae bacterium]|mgnify:CR=1 FL=1|nr:VOC family protein [Rubrobacteraceae bacterium]
MTAKPIRDGFHTITPYLFVRGVPQLITFLSEAFSAQVLSRESRPDGTIMHAELRVGDSMLMVGEATDEFGPMPTSIYLYVTDCDAVYRRALQVGGSSVFEIMNLPSGERYGGVKDPCGNIWWIATHVEDVPPEEQAKRWREFQR